MQTKNDKIVEWQNKQNELKQQLIFNDTIDNINYIAGVDISFVNNTDACVAYIILSYPDLKVVDVNLEMVKLTEEYIPGFLAFREVEHIKKLIDRVSKPELIPDVIFVDGNGILHPNEFGLACHLGVLLNIPTIGIGKNLHLLGDLNKKSIVNRLNKEWNENKKYIELEVNNKVLGAAFKPNKELKNPIYISVGHKISFETAIKLTNITSIFRVPEAIRQADKLSREHIRNFLKNR